MHLLLGTQRRDSFTVGYCSFAEHGLVKTQFWLRLMESHSVGEERTVLLFPYLYNEYLVSMVIASSQQQ